MNAESSQEVKNTFVPNSYPTPNAFVDDLMYLLKPKEWVVLSFMTRHILGWQRHIDSRCACMALTMIENGFEANGVRYMGCGLSRPTIVSALEKLVEFKIIIKEGEATEDGQCYRIPDNDSEVNFAGLRDRNKDEALAGAQRTKQARDSLAAKRASVGQTEGTAVNATNRQRLMPLTASGQSHLPNDIHIKPYENQDSILPEDAGALPAGQIPDPVPGEGKVTVIGVPATNVIPFRKAEPTVEDANPTPPGSEPSPSSQPDIPPAPAGKRWIFFMHDQAHLVRDANQPTVTLCGIKPLRSYSGTRSQSDPEMPCPDCLKKIPGYSSEPPKPAKDTVLNEAVAIHLQGFPPGHTTMGTKRLAQVIAGYWRTELKVESLDAEQYAAAARSVEPYVKWFKEVCPDMNLTTTVESLDEWYTKFPKTRKPSGPDLVPDPDRPGVKITPQQLANRIRERAEIEAQRRARGDS